MAITITWDLRQDAEATIARNNGDRLVRCGIVKGLSSENTTSEKALMDAIRKAADGIPTEYPDADVDATLAYVTARPHAQNPHWARIWAGYEPPSFSGSPVDRFAIEDVTQLVGDSTMFLPGTMTPLLATLTPPVANANTPAYNAALVAGDTRNKVVTASYPRNYRALVLNGLFSSKPSTAMRNAANKVNESTWQGLAKGYWKCEGTIVRWASGSGLYQVRVGFLSRGSGPAEDWSTYELLRHPLGDFHAVSATLMTNLIALPYAKGVQTNHSGLFRAGLYDTANFGAIFDPLIDDTPLATSDGFANLVGR